MQQYNTSKNMIKGFTNSNFSISIQTRKVRNRRCVREGWDGGSPQFANKYFDYMFDCQPPLLVLYILVCYIFQSKPSAYRGKFIRCTMVSYIVLQRRINCKLKGLKLFTRLLTFLKICNPIYEPFLLNECYIADSNTNLT